MFPFNQNVPTTGHLPAQDYQTMQQNNVSSAGIIAVDHLGYGTNGAGTHTKTTFNQFASPSTPSGNGSVAYPAAGLASNSTAQYYFQNSQGTFLASGLRAFIQIAPTSTSGSSAIVSTNNNNFNLTFPTSNQNFNPFNAILNFTLSLNNNVVTGNNALVFINFNDSTKIFTSSYTLVGGVLTINTNLTSSSVPTLVNVMILQA